MSKPTLDIADIDKKFWEAVKKEKHIRERYCIMNTWKIANLERNAADDGVVVAHWRCTAEDGEYTASSYGTVSFTPDPTAEGFVPFDELTEATVIGWVQAELEQDAIEARLAAQIEEAKAPAVIAGVPW